MRNREMILKELKAAVAEERQCALRVLHLLREVERDQHFLAMGYPTLFEFAIKVLGYSAGAAHRRIQSMRLIKTLPELEQKIEDGSLSLCVAAKTQSFFRKEDQKRREEGQTKLTLDTKREIAQKVVGTSSRECERKLVEISPESALPSEKSRPVAKDQTLIQFVANQELMEKLEKLKGLLAHQNYDGRTDRLIEILANMALKTLDPEQKQVRAKKSAEKVPANRIQESQKTQEPALAAATPTPNPSVANVPACSTPILPASTFPAPIFPLLEKCSEPSYVEERSRTIPASLKRRVWLRDGARCTYTDPQTGRRCESRHALQYDHAIPFAWNGETTEENLRLRCAPHNAFTAQRQGLMRKRS